MLLAITVLLTALGIWGQYLRCFPDVIQNISGPWYEFGLDFLSHEFDLNAEQNIPTYFNTLLLVISAALFGIIAAHKRGIKDKFRYHWTFLALLFLYLSVDETAVIHEKLIKPIRAAIGIGNWFYFAWVVPAIIVLAVLALAYITFFLHLSTRFKILFFTSLFIYFAGAVGGEMLSGHFAEILGQRSFAFAVISSLEEAVELGGASLLIFALLKYMGFDLKQVSIKTE